METQAEAPVANESLARDIVGEFDAKRKFQSARKLAATTIVYFCAPSKLVPVILGEDQKSYTQPVSYFCTSVAITLALASLFGTGSNDHESRVDAILEDFIPILLLLIFIVPGASCAHLLLRGHGRKVRHMVYIQCYFTGLGFLLAGIGGTLGILNNDTTGIQQLLQVPFALLFGGGGIVAWYLAKAVYQVSFPRLLLAGFVGGVCGSIVSGFFVLAALAG